MTVEQLIKELSGFEPDAEVFVPGDAYGMAECFPFSVDRVAMLNVTRMGFGTSRRPTKRSVVFLWPGRSLHEEIRTRSGKREDKR